MTASLHALTHVLPLRQASSLWTLDGLMSAPGLRRVDGQGLLLALLVLVLLLVLLR